MKIKSIDNFTLADCQEYLAASPNGEFAKEVSKRALELSKINVEDKDPSPDVQEQFIIQFNRLFVTKRYPEAFLLCVNSIHDPILTSIAQGKGELVIPYLLKKGVIYLPNNVNIDFIIETLINNGYRKLHLKKNVLLSIFPNVRIDLQDNTLTVKLPVLLIVLVVLYPLLPIILPLLACALRKRCGIIKIVCRALLQLSTIK